jgi:hypothetical protein
LITMRRRAARILLAGAIAATTVILGTGSASADPIVPSSWTISPGGSFTGNAGTTVLTDVDNGVQLSCESSTAAGTTPSGSGLTNPLAAIPASPGIQFISCTGPFGLSFDVTQEGDWSLVGDTYDPATGLTSGRITNVRAHLTGFACNAVVTGEVHATYDNAGNLAILHDPVADATLVISEVDPTDNCFGLVGPGGADAHHSTFDGSYLISPVLTVTGQP